MSDIFREVDEELRQDRMKRLAQRYGGLAAAVALVIVAGTAGYVGWKRWQAGKQQDMTAQLEAAITAAAQKSDNALPALTSFAEAAGGSSALAALARLDAAAALIRDGHADQAIQIYDALAATPGTDAIWRDLAILLSVTQQVDKGEPAALEQRLAGLLTAGNPWRFSAREVSALLAAKAGNRDKARELYQQLADDALTPPSLRGRAADLAAYFGRAG